MNIIKPSHPEIRQRTVVRLTALCCLAVTLLIPLTLDAVSLNSQGTAYWKASWNPPSEIDYTFSASERKYAFKGNGTVVRGNETDALPNLYFTYRLEGLYDINTGTAKESMTVSGSDPVFSPSLKYSGTFNCPSDPWLHTNVSCSATAISGNIDPKKWFVPPMRNRTLTAAQIKMLNDAALKEAKKLDIIEPRESASYKASSPVLFMIRQHIPADISLVPTQEIRLQIEEVNGKEQTIIKALSATGTGAYWGTSIDMKPGTWRARGYSVKPEFQNPNEVSWKTFNVTGQPALGEPLQKPVSIISPVNGNTYLSGQPLTVKLTIGQQLVKPGSIAELSVMKHQPTATGAWPLPPVEVYEKKWAISSLSQQQTIPANALSQTGTYTLDVIIYPDGKTGQSYISHKASASFTIAKFSKIQPLIKKPVIKLIPH